MLPFYGLVILAIISRAIPSRLSPPPRKWDQQSALTLVNIVCSPGVWVTPEGASSGKSEESEKKKEKE
jgi:hypothetical protein